MSHTCNLCDEKRLYQDIEKCTFCRKFVCYDCGIFDDCNYCRKEEHIFCQDCNGSCFISSDNARVDYYCCSESICPDCTYTCADCTRKVCNNCFIICTSCGANICNECLSECEDCVYDYKCNLCNNCNHCMDNDETDSGVENN
jgi:hypothetical protein